MAIEMRSATEEFCDNLVKEACADERAMTRHPFVQTIVSGTATIPQIVEWGLGQYRLVADAQRWTALGFAQLESQSERAAMLPSFIEEETGMYTETSSHAELVVDFLEALGQPRDKTYEASRHLRRRMQHFCDYTEYLGRCKPYWVYRGVVSLAGEAQFSETCKLVIAGLQEHYDVPESGLTFWRIHISLDDDHTSNAVQLVKGQLDSEANRDLLAAHVSTYMDVRYQAWLEPMLEN